ncbi:hypothetical protein N825_06150 [Skermanella stibiiresistens SB22]|uniref:Uncharacterized protein n=2 Tax=Skermanella TaxID=204447 RepID=W9H4H2_9PROT|nr:hypothetical protein N825_06150 [Skermanella stibiiresistens SB22]
MRIWIYGYRSSLAALGLDDLRSPGPMACLRHASEGGMGRGTGGSPPVIGFRGQRQLVGSPP